MCLSYAHMLCCFAFRIQQYIPLFIFIVVQAEASPGELVGVQLVAAPAIDTESSPQVSGFNERTKRPNEKTQLED